THAPPPRASAETSSAPWATWRRRRPRPSLSCAAGQRPNPPESATRSSWPAAAAAGSGRQQPRRGGAPPILRGGHREAGRPARRENLQVLAGLALAEAVDAGLIAVALDLAGLAALACVAHPP